MNISYKKYKFITLFFLLFYCLFILQGEEDKALNGKAQGYFKGAFIRLTEKGPIPITGPVIPEKMLDKPVILFYEPHFNAYIYIYALLPGKEFRLIRPAAFKDFKKLNYKYTPGYIYFTGEERLPPEAGCWEIHFLVSVKRLPDVEKLITELSTTSREKKELLTELANKLKKKVTRLKAEIILGDTFIEFPDPVNAPFREDELSIEKWLDKNAAREKFTEIYESVYYYGCEAAP